MKILKLKSILFSLMAIAMVTVFLTSCEREIMDSSPSLEEKMENYEIPEGHLAAILDLRDENNPEKGAIIAVSTNNEEIFAQLTDINFKAELFTIEDLEYSEEKELEDIDRAEENVDESLLNTEEHFFSMKILKEYTEEGEAILFTFGDELLNVLKKYKAQTHMKVTLEEDNSVNSRYYSLWRNYFKAWGDGGQIPTKLRVGYDYGCSSNFYYKETSSGFYWSYPFHSCQWPWTSSSRKRYSSFIVTQDVLKKYTRYNTSNCSKC